METGAAFVAPDRYAGGRQAAADWIRRYKSETPCAECGESHPWWRMEADHVDGSTFRERVEQRRQTPSRGQSHNNATFSRDGMRRMIEEIEAGTVEIVCANCHKDRTHQRRERNA